jgi:hypothetical protein
VKVRSWSKFYQVVERFLNTIDVRTSVSLCNHVMETLAPQSMTTTSIIYSTQPKHYSQNLHRIEHKLSGGECDVRYEFRPVQQGYSGERRRPKGLLRYSLMQLLSVSYGQHKNFHEAVTMRATMILSTGHNKISSGFLQLLTQPTPPPHASVSQCVCNDEMMLFDRVEQDLRVLGLLR